jgi:hypothetical protein
VKFPSSLVKRLRRIGVETRLKGHRYFEIERIFFNKLGVLIDGDFKFGVLLLVFVRFLGNLYRNGVFFLKNPLESWHLLKVDRVFISFMFRSVNLSILQKTINKTSKSPHAFAICSIRIDLLKQENEKIDSL